MLLYWCSSGPSNLPSVLCLVNFSVGGAVTSEGSLLSCQCVLSKLSGTGNSASIHVYIEQVICGRVSVSVHCLPKL